jgi:hypothetical protein
MMTFSDLQNAVLRLSPNQLTVNPADPSNVGAIVNDAYSTLLRFKQWVACTKTTVITTRAPYSTGTIAINQGSNVVTGSGVNWPANVVAGQFIKINNGIAYRITAVLSNQLVLDVPWGTASVYNVGYQITGNRFQLPSDAERVIGMAGKYWALARDNGFLLDIEDPVRVISGSPLVYSEVTTYGGNSGPIEVELWPYPSENLDYSLTYRATIPALVNSTDVPVLPGETIMKSAQAEACGILAGRTGETMWLSLGKGYHDEYVELRDSLAREDRRRQGSRPTVLDVEDIPNFNDPGWLSAFRAMQSLSLTKIA